MITDAQFNDWLIDDNRKPVWSMEIHGFDVNDIEYTLYVSNADYMHPEFIFWGILQTPEISQSMSSSVAANYSQIGVGDVTLDDSLGELSHWRTLRHSAVTVRLGDANWGYDMHRDMMHATVDEWIQPGGQHEIKLLDNQALADTKIKYAGITTKTGLAGVLLKGLLIDCEAFVAGDIDQPSFDALDVAYPYSFKIESFDDDADVLNLADDIIKGLPVDYGVNLLNKVQIYFFKRPVELDAVTVTLVEDPDIGGTIYPLSKLTLTNDAYADVEWTDTTVDDDWGANARDEKLDVAITNSGHANTLATELGALYDTPIDPVALTIVPANVVLGSTVYFEHDDCGYDMGAYAVVTDVTYRDDEWMTIEMAIWR